VALVGGVMNEDTNDVLQDHILECSQNYGELKNEVALQNQKIDTLSEKVHELYEIVKSLISYLVVGALGIAGYLIKHFILT
jgi:hypothetical protein